MELSQSCSFETAQGAGRKATHDFLSLYTHSPVQAQQDSRPSSGGFLKTHNFLQRSGEGKNAPQECDSADTNLEKPPPAAAQCSSAVEHLLPRGIGTYSISRISYLHPRVPKSEENAFTVSSLSGNNRNGENSNCSSYTGSGFTLWDESLARSSEKENMGDVTVQEPISKEGKRSLDQMAQSSSNHHGSISPLLSFHAPVQKNQSFMEMINSAKRSNSMEEDEESMSLKRDSSSSQKGELRVKVDGKISNQKPSTPRSKHSATEQRRRCKINDRFQRLRGLIPHSDQKRDKASFLSEVIEYIQFLQEKVNRYEGSYPGWSNEPSKPIPWTNHLVEGLSDQLHVVNGIASPMLVFGAKLDEKTAAPSTNIQMNPQILSEPNASSTIDFKMVGEQSGMTYKAVSNSLPLQPDVCAPFRNNSVASKAFTRLPSEANNASLAQLQLWQNKMLVSEPVASADKLNDSRPAVEGGSISISSTYSQGLLTTLTRALQSSGVDLSQASISVQVDVGKRANNRQKDHDAVEKKIAEAPSCNQSFLHTRVDSTNLKSDRTVKRVKTI